MEYGRPFQMVFRSSDPRIKAKLLTGTLYVLCSILLTVLLIGIAGFWILGGYSLRLLRNVQNGEEHPLPEWDQWRSDLRGGFFLFLASIVWFLPFIILSVVVNWSAAGDIWSAFGDVGNGSFPSVSTATTSSLVSLLSTIAGLIIGPGISIALAQRMQLADVFSFGSVLAWIGQNWTRCLVVSLVAALASILIAVVSMIAGTIALGIGLIVAVPFMGLMSSLYQYHLYGQLAQASDLNTMFPDEAVPS